jgi:2-dehydro-3-deoxyphosphooctonate aldolase (KDO 8-P synthase)
LEEVSKGLEIGGRNVSFDDTPLLIAGPCVLEDFDTAMSVAERCAEIAEREGYFYVFKSSYLKDNRTSIESYTGPGLEAGVEMLDRIRRRLDVPVLTDVHCRSEIAPVAEVCDVIQIPAFLARQTRLVVSAAGSGKVLNLKKGQFLSPEEMGQVVEKARSGGARDIIVTERGTCFGYHNLVVDFTAFPRMSSFGVPLVFDATHSLQLPGGMGARSGGRPEYAAVLARAAFAAGCSGLFIETHPDPLSCRCDGEAMLRIDDLSSLLRSAIRVYRAVGKLERTRT